MKHIRITLNGIVQGVGFRPFVYKEAIRFKLNGWVTNSSEGVIISVEGIEEDIFSFIDKLLYDAPSLSKIEFFKTIVLDLEGFKIFEIRESSISNKIQTLISPDIATCNECESELNDIENLRRFNLPFNNCTNCGPRYTIINSLPYDRRETAMNKFNMCVECQKEYRDPLDRRFHAEPICCNDCGPKVSLVSIDGQEIESSSNAFIRVKKLILEGNIIAVKGVGGFNIVCNAKDQEAIERLRKVKNRPFKPLAVMFRNLEVLNKYCTITEIEEEIITGNKKPIILIKKIKGMLLESISSNDNVGAILPYSPLHYMLFSEEIDAIIFTSGNAKGIPLNYKNDEALNSLKGIAEYVLFNNRDIIVPIDDSVVKVMHNDRTVIRPGRGYAPYSFRVKVKEDILAMGSELKNTFSLSTNGYVFVSPYNGDMVYEENINHFKYILNHFMKIYNPKIKYVARDARKDGFENSIELSGAKILPVYHHHAHIASCIAEHNIKGAVIGVAYDGIGYGEDGAIWGGEFLICGLRGFKRVAHIDYFKLIGGDKATLNPWRVAYELCTRYIEDENEYDELFSEIPIKDRNLIRTIKKVNINSFDTSSIGRVFDGIAYVLGFNRQVSYEGEAAIYLETMANQSEHVESYRFETIQDNLIKISIKPIIQGIINDLRYGANKGYVARKFHNTVIEFTVDVVMKIAASSNIDKVALSGGVFQNTILRNDIKRKLSEAGLKVFTNNTIPTNDSGISYGQLFIAKEYFNL